MKQHFSLQKTIKIDKRLQTVTKLLLLVWFSIKLASYIKYADKLLLTMMKNVAHTDSSISNKTIKQSLLKHTKLKQRNVAS